MSTMTQHEAGKAALSHMYSETMLQTSKHLPGTNGKMLTKQQGFSCQV